MPETLDIDSDDFLKLLTDALRAGPGSPEWRQAVQQLRSRKDDRHDEYAMLCEAREHLESGKAYRSVVAGPGFTRKVLSGIDEEEPASIETKVQAPPTANLVAIISLIVLVAVIGVLAYFFMPAGDPNRTALDDLDKLYFPTGPATTFAGGIPSGWREIGPLPLDTTRDLRAAAATQPIAPADAIQGGGAVMSSSIAPTETVAVEVSLSVPQISNDVSAQVFITDEPIFSQDRATAPHELVWMLKGNSSTVFLPNRGRAGGEQKIQPGPDPLLIRVVMNRDLAMIDSGGARLWAGNHQLSADKPRYVGVRFVRSGPKPSAVAFESLRVAKAQQTTR